LCTTSSNLWGGFDQIGKARAIVQRCLRGELSHAARHPHSQEQHSLVVRGNVFVYNKVATGIGIWNDGADWSHGTKIDSILVRRQSPNVVGSATTRKDEPLPLRSYM